MRRSKPLYPLYPLTPIILVSTRKESDNFNDLGRESNTTQIPKPYIYPSQKYLYVVHQPWHHHEDNAMLHISRNIGTGLSFIMLDDQPHRLLDKIEPLGDDVAVQNGREKPFSLLLSIVLTLELGNSV